MDAIAKSDIFFFITTVCVVLFTLVTLVVGAYVWTIIADVRYIVRKAKDGADEIADDLQAIRETLKDRGRTIGSILSAFFAFRAKKKSRKKSDED